MAKQPSTWKEIFLYSSLAAAMVSALFQTLFLWVQNNIYKKRQKEDEIKKTKFILEAFLNESKYNFSLIQRAEKGSPFSEQYFDTQCYSLFKENIALLEEAIRDKINELYIELFKSNSQIKYCRETSTMSSIKGHYLAPKEKIESFIKILKNE